MKSMTGYASAVFEREDYTLTLDIRSVNGRFIDVNTVADKSIEGYETEVEREVKKRIRRGTVTVKARVKFKSKGNADLDESLLLSYKELVKRMAALTELNTVSLSDYLKIDPNIFSLSERKIPLDDFMISLSKTISSLVKEKEREGEEIKKYMKSLSSSLLSKLLIVEEKSEENERIYKEKLLEKYREITAQEAKEELFFSELASILLKYTAAEEISRLKTHIKEYDRLTELDEEVGKRIEFLSQEMMRECNTLCQKSQISDMSITLVEMKTLIEDIKEMSRNIE